jgi:hypothetical protein
MNPQYETVYCAEWAPPYGLLHVAALLTTHGYRKAWRCDLMEAGEDSIYQEASQDAQKRHKVFGPIASQVCR